MHISITHSQQHPPPIPSTKQATRPLFDSFDHDARVHQLSRRLSARLAPIVMAVVGGGGGEWRVDGWL
jgi:hypothetical protein